MTSSALQSIRTYVEELEAAGDLDREGKNWRTSLPRYPTTKFGAGESCLWRLDTSEGDIAIRFDPAVAPNHVANFIYLTELQFFDGLIFHRIIPGFMAQGGCPLGSGTGDPGYRFDGETSAAVKHDRAGLLSMANAGRSTTDGSQFFLTFAHTPWLDGKHTIFGRLHDGEPALRAIEKLGSRDGRPSKVVTLKRATITPG